MRLTTLVIAAVALVAFGKTATATTITQTESFGPQATNWGSPTAVPLNFSGFDTSLGTLTGVSITVTEDTAGTLQNTNTGSSTCYGDEQT